MDAAMAFGNRSWDDWVRQYASSHQNAINRACHTFGIPLIALSLLMTPFMALWFGIWKVALGLFSIGWALQFIGHAFEGKPPEFLHDWRFLFVGLRWWVAKIRGRA
jgi:uncharacterized membrane protein YGL010W